MVSSISDGRILSCFMIITPTVLADNTAIHAVRSAVGMILSSSVRLSVTKCIVAKRYILQQKCLNK